MTAAADELSSIAAELYELPPTEFTAARNERAKRESTQLAKEVRALPKPSAAAWAVDLLVRERGEQVAQLFALGDALREAQTDLDRTTLTKLGSERRTLIAALAKQAASLAADAGHAVNAAAVVDIERTLQAGMTDAAAAAAVTSKRLVRALAGDGLETVDLGGAVAGALPEPRLASKATAPRKKLASRKQVDAAEAALASARTTADEAERAARQAQTAREALLLERDDLREQLADVEGELADATRAAEAADRKSTAAAREVEKAERARAKLAQDSGSR